MQTTEYKNEYVKCLTHKFCPPPQLMGAHAAAHMLTALKTGPAYNITNLKNCTKQFHCKVTKTQQEGHTLSLCDQLGQN